MPRMVICATPIVRVFLRQFHPAIMELEDQAAQLAAVQSEDPFTFDIVTGTTAVKIAYNKPIEIRGMNDREIESQFRWLTGGEGGREFSDTDAWGVVPYEPKIDMAARLDEMARLEAFILEGEDGKSATTATKELAKLRSDSKRAMLDARSGARKASEERVLRAARLQRRNLERQWQTNDQMKLGKEPMSSAEYLVSLLLEKEIAKVRGQTEKIRSRMDDSFATQLPG